jgi:taurine--2-oxoglutarate transaminase
MRTRFDALQSRHPSIGEVRGIGAFFGIEIVSDRDKRTPMIPWQGAQSLAPFYNDLLARGVYIYGRYNVIIVAPPLTISEKELDEAIDIFDAAFTELEKGK